MVDPNGTLARNKGAASAQKNATGQYQVVFSQDVTGLQLSGDARRPDHHGVSPGQITAFQLRGVAAGIRVNTYNSAGASDRRDFFVAVFC